MPKNSRFFSVLLITLSGLTAPAFSDPPSPLSDVLGMVLGSIDSPKHKVKEIQQLLAVAGYHSGEIDGEMGEDTRAAIQRFQKENNFPVTGFLTRRQIRVLNTQAKDKFSEAFPSGVEENAHDARHSSESVSEDASHDDTHAVEQTQDAFSAGVQGFGSEAPCSKLNREAWESVDAIKSQLRSEGISNHAIEGSMTFSPNNAPGNCPMKLPKIDATMARAAHAAGMQAQQQAMEQAQQQKAEDLKMRDASDVVAQVLNYTVLGKDLPESGFFYKEKDCFYKQHNTTITIDLNGLDPRNITFEEDPVYDRGEYRGMAGSVKYEGHLLLGPNLISALFGDGKRDIQRLKRGWELIYARYCKGQQKAF